MLYQKSAKNTLLTDNELESDVLSSIEWCHKSEIGELTVEPSIGKQKTKSFSHKQNGSPRHEVMREFRKNRDRWKVDFKMPENYVHPDIEFGQVDSISGHVKGVGILPSGQDCTSDSSSMSAITFQRLFEMGKMHVIEP